MVLSREEVQHIADLARIELTEDEQEKFGHELSAILEFVGKLNEVDTKGVEPMTGGTAFENVMREDATIDTELEGKQAVLLEAVPEKKDGWVKVKSVF